MRERFEQRLFRIFAQAGYSPVQLLTITPEEMVEIPGSAATPSLMRSWRSSCRKSRCIFPFLGLCLQSAAIARDS